MTASRRLLRRLLLTTQPYVAFAACRLLVSALWPFHCVLWKFRNHKVIERVRTHFLRFSPVVDYHAAYAQIGSDLLRDWALLDTHDTLTDVYKHLRSPSEIESSLKACGLTEIYTAVGGNGVEALARKLCT